MKPTVYIETTIASYLTSRPSRDLVLAAHQQVTRDWWDGPRLDYESVISPVVIDEASRGDTEAAEKRLEVLRELTVLDAEPEIEQLANDIRKTLDLPDAKELDAFHLAYAIFHRVDCFVTWNCAHFANPQTERRMIEYCTGNKLWLPVICTPEEMMSGEGVSSDAE